MRNILLLLRLFLFVILALSIAGCGSGRPQNDRITDEEALSLGMVQDPETGSWSYPPPEPEPPYDDESRSNADADDGYGDEGYGDEASDEVADDAQDDEAARSEQADNEEVDTDDDYGDASSSSPPSSAVGYASNEGYGGYGDDPYAQQQADPKYYAEKVAPILRAHCYNCHGGGPRGRRGKIALHSPDEIDEAYVITAGDPEGSMLYEVITSTDPDTQMPPRGPRLSAEEVGIIAKWIKDGASFGDAPRSAAPSGGGAGDDPYAEAGYGGETDGYGNTEDNAPPVQVQPQNLGEWASFSMQNGRDKQAMNHLYAQALLRSGDAERVLEMYQWYPGMKRAKLAIRWGVGIKYQGKSRYEGRPRPVGVVQDLPGDEYDDVEESEDEIREFQNDTLEYYTGDIGQELLVRLKNRIERSDYGEFLKGELAKSMESRAGDEDDFYDDDRGRFNRNTAQFSGYGGVSRGGGDDDDDDKPDGDKIEQLMPGVTLLGVAGTSDLMQRAQEQGIDLMVIFDVVADPNRVRRFVDTSTRVRLYDVATEEQLAVTGKINNVEIQKLRSENPDDETVILEMGKIFTDVDENYRAKTFPDVTSAKGQKAVIGFVKNALAHPSKDPLWKLSEIRFYEHRGGLKPEHALAAMKKIVPAQAAKLQTVASEDEIRSLLGTWLTVEAAAPSEPDDEDDDLDDEDRDRGEDEFR